MNVADILDNAADVIEANGWHQGDLWPSPTRNWKEGLPVCAMGAIRVASANEDTIQEIGTCSEVTRYVTLYAWMNVGTHLVTFNDQVAKSPSEVIDLLRDAAKAYRNEH